jgi:glycosyltransferase involved in cell wall biosynthesis
MTLPRVSVIVPNYNHSALLPRCLGALLNQSHMPDEIIVMDDKSTDNSMEVLLEFDKKYPVVRVHRNEQNMGVNKTLNLGLKLASHDYVFFTAADDEVKPGIFAHTLPMLAAHPQAGLACGMCEWRCTATGMKWYMGSNTPGRAGYLAPAELIRFAKRGRLTLSSQCSIFNKAAYIRAGACIPELKWFTDWFNTYVVAFRHGVCFIPEVLSVFYLHPNSYYNSAQSLPERRETMNRLLCFLESPEFADVSPVVRESGMLGGFGYTMARVMIGDRAHRQFFNFPFLRHLLRRCAEVVGRRWFPDWLARACLKLFYGRRQTGAQSVEPK